MKVTPVGVMLRMKKTNRLIKSAMDAATLFFASSRIPMVTRIIPWLNPSKSDVRWLPINNDIKAPESAPLPLDLLDRFIEEASHRVIIDKCACRVGQNCRNHPKNIGCLFLGDSALDMPDKFSREVSVDEARRHIRKAVDNGLVPCIGKIRLDNILFMVKDRSKLISICFCCDCCCITRYTRFMKTKDLDGILHKTEGVSIKVTGDCIGCGICADSCYMKAVKVVDGRADIGESCRTCGRCALACPNKAIEISIDDPGFLDEAYSRITSYVSHR